MSSQVWDDGRWAHMEPEDEDYGGVTSPDDKGYEAWQAAMEAECHRSLSVGPDHDPYMTQCEQEKGHKGPHEGPDPYGAGERWRWVGGGSWEGEPLPRRFWVREEAPPAVWQMYERVVADLEKDLTPQEYEALKTALAEGDVTVERRADNRDVSQGEVWRVTDHRTDNTYYACA